MSKLIELGRVSRETKGPKLSQTNVDPGQEKTFFNCKSSADGLRHLVRLSPVADFVGQIEIVYSDCKAP